MVKKIIEMLLETFFYTLEMDSLRKVIKEKRILFRMSEQFECNMCGEEKCMIWEDVCRDCMELHHALIREKRKFCFKEDAPSTAK